MSLQNLLDDDTRIAHEAFAKLSPQLIVSLVRRIGGTGGEVRIRALDLDQADDFNLTMRVDPKGVYFAAVRKPA